MMLTSSYPSKANKIMLVTVSEKGQIVIPAG